MGCPEMTNIILTIGWNTTTDRLPSSLLRKVCGRFRGRVCRDETALSPAERAASVGLYSAWGHLALLFMRFSMDREEYSMEGCGSQPHILSLPIERY